MRTFTKLLAIPVAAGFLFAAGCGGGDLCEKAFANMNEIVKKEAPPEAKKKAGMAKDELSKQVEKCKAELKKDPSKKASLECLAKAESEKDVMGCIKEAAKSEKKASKKDDKKAETHK